MDSRRIIAQKLCGLYEIEWICFFFVRIFSSCERCLQCVCAPLFVCAFRVLQICGMVLPSESCTMMMMLILMRDAMIHHPHTHTAQHTACSVHRYSFSIPLQLFVNFSSDPFLLFCCCCCCRWLLFVVFMLQFDRSSSWQQNYYLHDFELNFKQQEMLKTDHAEDTRRRWVSERHMKKKTEKRTIQMSN